MAQWYVLQTILGKEEEAAALLKKKIGRSLWQECRVLKKIKVFRSGGVLHLLEGIMFPGYVLVKTACPSELADSLGRARDFPQPPKAGKASRRGDANVQVDAGVQTDIQVEKPMKILAGTPELVPMESADLRFLQSVCGENLERTMGVTRIALDSANQILQADGALSGYLNQIVKLNLHKRFAVVEIELFNRKQDILFGLQLEQDQAG